MTGAHLSEGEREFVRDKAIEAMLRHLQDHVGQRQERVAMLGGRWASAETEEDKDAAEGAIVGTCMAWGVPPKPKPEPRGLAGAGAELKAAFPGSQLNPAHVAEAACGLGELDDVE